MVHDVVRIARALGAVAIALAVTVRPAHAQVATPSVSSGSDASGSDDSGLGPDPGPPQLPPPPGPPDGTLTDVHDAATLGIFLGGAAVGFIAHESGHVVTNLAYGNVPTIIYIKPFGFVPFFAISPQVNCTDDGCFKKDGSNFSGGRPGLYVIVTAGFSVQHITTELLLSLEPGLRYHRAPFRKGVLAFDILVSVGYAVASFTNTEDPFGDITAASRASHINHDVFAALLIAPALLDGYRFVRPGSRWVPVVSRTLNATMFGITFAI